MVKVVNIFKAAGLWVGTIFLLYGADDVERQVATQYYSGFGTALAPSRSAESGAVTYGGKEFHGEFSQPHSFMSSLESKIGGQTGKQNVPLKYGGTGRFKTPVTERGGGYG